MLRSQCLVRPSLKASQQQEQRQQRLGSVWRASQHWGVRAARSRARVLTRASTEDGKPIVTAVAVALTKAEVAAAKRAEADKEWKWEKSDDSIMAYGAVAALLMFGLIPGLQSSADADLPYFLGLALTTIYIGAHRSLTTDQRQMINFNEGLLAPFLASFSLFGCYLLVKYLPDFSLQTFLNGYFWLLASFSTVGAATPLLRKLGGQLGQLSLSVPVPDGLLIDENGDSIERGEFAPTDLIALSLGFALATANLEANSLNYTINNLVAVLIASDILQLVGLRSFRTAGLVLVGLLVYDVFWVFGSEHVFEDNVMLTVATSDMINGPMRILFPRFSGSTGQGSDFPFSLLGLGDIVVPGLLACLALRYDASRSVDMRARADAAVTAIKGAFAELDDNASMAEMGDSAADAALLAYDKVADKENAMRERSIDGTNIGKGPKDSPNSLSTGGVATPERVPVSDAVLVQRPYFNAVAVSYVGGLLVAFIANAVTHIGQPALLYIVPATLGSVIVTGAVRGELGRLWAFTDVATFGTPGEAAKRAIAKEEADKKAALAAKEADKKL